MDEIRGRVEREKSAYDGGTVWDESRRLHRRFEHVFSGPNTAAAEAYFQQILSEEVPGAVVLDFGCYVGELSEEMAALGPAKVVGIDISETAIQEAVEARGELAEFHQMDGHNLEFADGTFDFVVGRAILHHLDYGEALREIHRVLKPGGCALFFEPLRDNPAAKLLRMLTPKARTVDELPLSRGQVLLGDEMFGRGEHRWVNLCSVPAGMLSTHLLPSPDNPLTRSADRIDRWVAETPFRYWMRSVVLVWRKRTAV